ncbi:MAG: sialate O-acetylesterase [Planctomycetaceae bacterium]
MPDDAQQFHLFILAGQSNMAGRGIVEDVDKQPVARVLMLDQSGEWVPAVAPMHFDKPGIAGVGLGRTFAKEYAESHPDVVVGLIPCAVGGSPIESWQPNGYHAQTKSHPWDDCEQRVRIAMKDGTLRGVLWHQGESDSRPDLAKLYEMRLHALVKRFRETFAVPELPFIAGQLGQFEGRPWNQARKTVDAAHRMLPEKLPYCGFVPSNGLTPNDDLVHFNTESLRELGRRYHAVLMETVNQTR